MSERELIERVMTEHWDMFACSCKFCRVARELGYSPRTGYPSNPDVSILKAVDNGKTYDGEIVRFLEA